MVFRAAVDMLATKDFVYAIADGVAGDLAASAGMAGDDTIAHRFAAKYEPAARQIIEGISAAGQAIGITSGKLLMMAKNYLATDDAVAAHFLGGNTMLEPPVYPSATQAQCEENFAARRLPMVTGSREVHEIPLIGYLWPQGSPEKLRRAAQIWVRAASLLDQAQRNAGTEAEPVLVHCQGTAVEAFRTYAQRIYTASPSGGTGIEGSRPLLENLSAACRSLADLCTQFADAIETCRSTIIKIGIAIGVITAAGIILTVFTFGGSDAAAAAADAAAVAEATAAVTVLAAAEESLAAAAVVTSARVVVASTLERLAAAGVIAVVGATLTHPDPALAASPAIGPALPPVPSSGHFAPYGPADQAAATAWANGLSTRDPLYGTPADIAYQVRVAGSPERLVPTGGPPGPGDSVWADGYRPTDGALVDAKHVRELGCSPRSLDGLTQSQFATRLLQPGDEYELSRYSMAVANPANRVQYLEIDTNDRETVGYWQYLTARYHLPSDVRYVP